MTVTFPAREVPITRRTDVLVIGGGPAGVAAAIGAARAGAQVLILERAGFLGGVTTTNLYLRQSTLQGEGVDYRIIGGVAFEFAQRLMAWGGGNLRFGHLTYDYEIAKRTWDELVRDAGVDVLLHTTAFESIMDGNILRGVFALNKSGLQAFTADVIIDASGDGDVAAKAGAPFEFGRVSDGLTQPVTMMMRFGGVDMTAFDAYLGRDPRLRKTMAKAAAKGDFELFQDRLASIITWSGRPGVVNLNVTNQTRVDGTDGAQLSAAEFEGRRQVWLLFNFLKKYVDGWQHAWLIDTAPSIGVRETRRLIGEYVLTQQDVMEGREFADNVALGSYPVDIHNPDGLWVHLVYIKAPCYGIPYRCLVPLQVENLLVAGRIIRTGLYLPTIVPYVTTVALWMWLLDYDFGVFNIALRGAGLAPVKWLGSELMAKPSIVLIGLWQIGTIMMIFLAGLQDIPTHVYEAAEIDGANSMQKLFSITIPMLSPVIFFNLILDIINSVQVFTAAFIATNGGPLNATLFYVLYLYRQSFVYLRLGYGSALAAVLFIIVLVLTLLVFRSERRWVFYERV